VIPSRYILDIVIEDNIQNAAIYDNMGRSVAPGQLVWPWSDVSNSGSDASARTAGNSYATSVLLSAARQATDCDECDCASHVNFV
jgi:hypothetical protein